MQLMMNMGLDISRAGNLGSMRLYQPWHANENIIRAVGNDSSIHKIKCIADAIYRQKKTI